MRFLHRAGPATDGEDTSTDASVEAGRASGKGRPTPKRRDVEARRRGPAPPPPRTQREAMRRSKATRPPKEERRRAAAERRERMASGDERYLMPRDRGPVKAFVRDVVDSRPHIIGLFMPLAVIVLISALFPIPGAQEFVSLFSIVALATMIFEAVVLGRQVTRRAREKFPKEEISGFGIGWYVFSRASQPRKLRIPKPRVARGADV